MCFTFVFSIDFSFHRVKLFSMNSNDNESAGASGNSDLDHQNVDDCFSSFYTEV